MSLEDWIDWLSLDNEELLLDKSERAELLELLLELGNLESHKMKITMIF